MKGALTILLLTVSNLFMMFAWYGHLQFKKLAWFSKLGLVGIILVSWGLAFSNTCFRCQPIALGLRKTAGRSTYSN